MMIRVFINETRHTLQYLEESIGMFLGRKLFVYKITFQESARYSEVFVMPISTMISHSKSILPDPLVEAI